jgi:hypothetical protein
MCESLIYHHQTFSMLPSGNDRTYDVKGGKDISVIVGEEKQAFTAHIGSAADGTILPFQSIWKGKTTASLPKTRNQLMHHQFCYCWNEKNQLNNLKLLKNILSNYYPLASM